MTERERVREKLTAILGDSDKIASAVDNLDTALGLVKYCAAWGVKIYLGIGIDDDGTGIVEGRILNDDYEEDLDCVFVFTDIEQDAALAVCQAWLWLYEELWEWEIMVR